MDTWRRDEGAQCRGGGHSGRGPLRFHYVDWVDETEQVLRGVFLDSETWDGLQTPRYWHICTLGETSRRPYEVIRREVETQAARLEGLAAQLHDVCCTFEGRARAHDGAGYQRAAPLSDSKKRFVVRGRRRVPGSSGPATSGHRGAGREEVLDDRLYRRSFKASAQPAVGSSGNSGGSPVELKPGVTIEVPLDDGPRRRERDADQEVLDLCQDLQAVKTPVVLVTADTGMSLRANGYSIRVCCMPQRYRRLRP